jgi:hypothetical protein
LVVGRYVDDAAEYRTRAFLLHVRVEQSQIPTLLAELTNSSFPVEIVRVDAKFPLQTFASASVGRDDDDDDGRSGFNFGGRMGGIRSTSRRTSPGPRGMNRNYGRANLLSRLANTKVDPILANQGASQQSAALADPSLADVRIAGLMTIYRTKEENKAAAETEELEATESPQTNSETSTPPTSKQATSPLENADVQPEIDESDTRKKPAASDSPNTDADGA